MSLGILGRRGEAVIPESEDLPAAREAPSVTNDGCGARSCFLLLRHQELFCAPGFLWLRRFFCILKRYRKSLPDISASGKTVRKEKIVMTVKQRKIVLASSIIALSFGIVPTVSAMHIMEGFLPPSHCILWGVLCIPFLIAGFFSINRTRKEHRKTLLIFAMAGAYAFVLSALKIPSVTGSSSHMTGTGLGAILFGPAAVSILGLIVLIFQAVLLAHGGLTTLGANTFSMAIAGPLLTYGVYKLCQKMKMNRLVSIFLAAFLGDLFTYCVTSVQLAFSHPSEVGGMAASLAKFLGIFAVTQIPLAVIEGILTVIVIIGLESYAKSELKELGYLSR